MTFLSGFEISDPPVAGVAENEPAAYLRRGVTQVKIRAGANFTLMGVSGR